MMKKGAKVWSFIAILVFLFAIPSLCFVVMAGGVGVDGCLFGDQNIGKLEDLHSNSYQPKGANSKIITSLSTFEKGDKILNSKGDKGMILRGPEESYGINWWFIRWEKESSEGWSKENQLRKNDFYNSTKFSIDDPVEVCDSKGLYVRTDPPDLAWKGGVREGAKGTIKGGPFYGIPKDPVSEEKKILYHFWKVDFGSITGWCAEGWPYPGGVDYLKKVESPVIKSTNFKTGDFVRVIADAGRNIRTKPKLGDEYIKIPPSPLQKGSEGQIMEHENNGIFADGHYWWYLKFGVYDGWCAEDGLEKSETAPKVAKPVLTSPLKITPEKDKYYVGDTLTAQFTITNKGTQPITFDKLTVGGQLNGECPDNKCPDFTFRSTTLQPKVPYQYIGTFTLTHSGNYHFFIAYYIENPTPEEKKLLDENNWNTSVDLGDGLTDEDRIEDIEEVLLPEGPHICDINPASGVPDIEVTITGVNFPKPPFPWQPTGASVKFGDSYAIIKSYSWEETIDEIVAVVPLLIDLPADKTVQVALYTAFEQISNPVTFKYKYEEPVLEFIEPTWGSPGTKVELFGENFGYERYEVRFGASRAKVISWTNTAIEVEAPSDSGMGLGEAKTAYKILRLAMLGGDYIAFKFALWVICAFFPDLKELELAEDEPLLSQFLKISAAIAVPGVTVCPDGDFEVTVTVSTPVGESEALTTFTFKDTLETIDIEDSLIIYCASPAELRVYDSQGRITGLVDGKVKEEIPNSTYSNGAIIILSPADSYHYVIAGIGDGVYKLGAASVKNGEATTFTATDIPTTPGAIHQYTIDWTALSQGEKGVTVKIDSDGNGTFEHTIITNNSFHPLIAEFTFSPENPLIGEKVTLDASTSFDLGGGVIKKYRWEFYNAANQDPFYVIEGHDKKIIRYSFTSEGIYLVRLTVTDDEGEYSYTESSITIKEPIKEPVFYVPDDYPSIQAAVDAANAGDTIIVRDGTYTENVDIDKSITLKSSSGNLGNTIAQAANPNDHVFEITADYVNISGFTVGGVAECCKAVIFLNEVNYCNISNNHILNYTGIHLNYSNDNIIMNNNISKSGEGILLGSSNSNTVFNNTFSGYNLYSLGIGLKNSTNNLISDNTICNCPHGGIELGFASSNNIILNNTFKSCGLCVWGYEKNTVEGNTVNDKPLIYLENVSQIEIDNAGQVILINCELIKVIGCNLSSASIGVDLLNSSNCVIENNICRDNYCGGIDLHDYSSNNIVLNNIIENNFWGIFLTSYASNNKIVNNICENNYIGIHLRDTNNNRIYLNNLNNDCNVQSYNSCNIWNSKEKITYSYDGKSHTKYLGNYWSDYTGTDANKNGIGDSPYSIDDRGGDIDQDYYPLMTWSEHYFIYPPHPIPTLPTPPPTSTLTPTPRPTLTLVPRPTLTLVPRPTLTLAPRPTLTPNPRPTLRPTATLFEKIEGLIAAIRVGAGI